MRDGVEGCREIIRYFQESSPGAVTGSKIYLARMEQPVDLEVPLELVMDQSFEDFRELR